MTIEMKFKIWLIPVFSLLLTIGYTFGQQCKVFKAHSAFQVILTDKKYFCYGKPSENYRNIRCKLCGKYYILQKFCKDGKFTEQFYHSSSTCSKSRTGSHDHRKVHNTAPCACDDVFYIGDDF